MSLLMAAAASVFAAADGPRTPAAAAARPVVTRTALGSFDPARRVDRTFRLSHDCRHVAYRQRSGASQVVVHDGHAQAAHDSVGFPVFSPAGDRVAYVARDGQSWSVSVAGVDAARFPGARFVRDLTFSASGREMAYVVGDARGEFVVDRGRRQPPYARIEEGTLVYSADGRRLAYVARDEAGAFMVCDGRRGRSYASVGAPTFSPDGRRVAYPAARDSNWMLIADDRAGAIYHGVSSPTFSPDGRRLGYVASSGRGVFAVVDGVESAPYDAVGSIAFSPSGARVAFSAEADRSHPDGFRCFVVTDGREGKPYETVVEGTLVFSPDGRHTAYEAEVHDVFYAVVDSAAGKGYHDILNGTLQFLPTGARVAYIADLGGKRAVVVADREFESHADVFTLALGPRAEHVAYVVKAGDQRQVCLDGVPGEAWDEVIADAIAFDTMGHLHYVAVADHHLYHVEAAPPAEQR